jgi:hypothetical protein
MRGEFPEESLGDRREWRLIKDMFFCRPAGHARQAKPKYVLIKGKQYRISNKE